MGGLVNDDFAPFPVIQVGSVFWLVDCHLFLNMNLTLRSPSFMVLKLELTFSCNCEEDASSDACGF